jgi:predicted aspartyl protease
MSIPKRFGRSRVWRPILAAVVILVAPGAVGADEPAPTALGDYLVRLGYEPIPLKRDTDNHFVARGRLDGKETKFMVDTGWSRTSVNSSAGRHCKTLGQLGVELNDQLLGLVKNSNVVLVEKIQLGRAEFTNQPANRRDLHEAGNMDLLADCVLGCDFLCRNYALIDCLGSRLYVRTAELPANSREAMAESLRRSGFKPIKLKLGPGPVLAVPAHGAGQSLRLLVDSGGEWSMLNEAAVKRLGLHPRPTKLVVGGVKSVGFMPVSTVKLNDIEVGDEDTGVPLHGVEADQAKAMFGVVADLRRWGSASAAVDGLLGNEQLALSSALIDCRGLQLWMKPLPRKPAASTRKPD